MANLHAIASWVIRSSDAVDSEMVSFFSSGLKEKEALRRGHLRCLRIVSGNGEAIIRVNQQICNPYSIPSSPVITVTYGGEIFVNELQISSLLGPLIQLVKTGFTKAVQRLDGLYALLLVGKIAAADIKAGILC